MTGIDKWLALAEGIPSGCPDEQMISFDSWHPKLMTMIDKWLASANGIPRGWPGWTND